MRAGTRAKQDLRPPAIPTGAWSSVRRRGGTTPCASSGREKPMTGNKKRNTASNQEDEDDLIPDMTAPSYTGRFPKGRVTRARPKRDTPKVSTTIRFDPDARARCRAGWRSRRNAALSPWPAEHRSDAWRYMQGAPVCARYRQFLCVIN